MQNAENFLQPNCIRDRKKITFSVVLMWSSYLVFEPWAVSAWARGTLCVKILLWNGRTCTVSSWTSGLWIGIRTPALSTTAHLQRKAFKINKSAMDLADFKEEHFFNWTSGESPHEYSPEGKAAIERKCCPCNWELESLCLQWLRALSCKAARQLLEAGRQRREVRGAGRPCTRAGPISVEDSVLLKYKHTVK